MSGYPSPAHLCQSVRNQPQHNGTMPSTTLTLRVDSAVKKRLEKLAKSTGRSRSFLAAKALGEYLDVNEWQVEGIKKAIASLDRAEGIPHKQVEQWATSWGRKRERQMPKRSHA